MKAIIKKILIRLKTIFKRIVIRINRLFGRVYLVNHHSKEIHDLRREHVNCHLLAITDYQFVSHKDMIQLIDLTKDFIDGYNGCRFCNKKYDTDLKKKR